jgi:poly-gamma-glutamate capsule biosynthesis protein CapA/YwtB (metallophosphatase superfamily)
LFVAGRIVHSAQMGMPAGLRRSFVLAVVAGTAVAGVAVACARPPTVSSLPTPSLAGPATPTQPAPPRTFTVVASGDVLLHSSLWAQAHADAVAAGRTDYEFGPMFASVKPLVSSADLAICHMETPLGEPNGPFSGYPIFSGPPQVAATLAAIGYDSCSTASNHSLDKGATGVTRTLDVLDAAGIKHAGTARNPAEWATPTLMPAGGVTVGQLSYTFSFNGLRLPSDKPWLANPIDIDTILFDARRIRLAGAQVVIVSLHFGTEYSNSPNSYQDNVVRQLAASPDIDLILGHHAHVVQPLQRFGDKWVAYGMGNQVSGQSRLGTRDGIMPRFTFTEVHPGVFQVTKAEVIPIHMWNDGSVRRLYDIPAVLADPASPAYLRDACAGSLRRIRTVIGQRGAYADGLTLVGADLA